MNSGLNSNNSSNASKEYFYHPEFNNYASELSANGSETFTFTSNPSPPEAQDSSAKQKTPSTDMQKLKHLLSLLSGAVVTATTGVMILNPILSPKLTLQSQDVSFNKYECVIENKDLIGGLTATLTGENGESYTLELPSDNRNCNLTFNYLTPEVEYSLTVSDKNGKKHYENKFETEPFITFNDVSANAKNFSLNSDVLIENDFMLRLLNSKGDDFSSNLLFDNLHDATANFLYLDGLFKDSYTIEFQSYLGDEEPLIYTKTLDLGTLAPLKYTVAYSPPETADGSLLTLTYVEGDIYLYQIDQIILINLEYDDWIFIYDLQADGNDVYATITDSVVAGNYKVIVNGLIENEEYYLYNDIFSTEITIT